MAASMEDVIANLRAIIISSKGGLKLSEVKADYYETFGEEVPLKELGCNTLEEFFKSNCQNFTVIGNQVQAVSKSSSLHIVSLVNRQQTSKKRGRSKLSSKEARNLRKPLHSLNEFSVSVKKNNQSAPQRFLKQNVNKDNISSTLKQMRQMEHLSPSKRSLQNDISKPSEKAKEEKNQQGQSQIKNVEVLKNIKRTVVNDNIAKESISLLDSTNKTHVKNESKRVSFKDTPFFDEFEDLHISKQHKASVINLRSTHCKKSFENNTTVALTENSESDSLHPSSPFRRSLAKNSEEEILSAKRTAQIRLDNNNIDFESTKKKRVPIDLALDLEDDTKYEQKLKMLCLEKGMILPAYSIIIREPKNQGKCYGCKLSIGDSFHVSTYPVETHSEITARELASKKAYNQLCMNKNLSSSIFETEHVLKLRELCFKKNLPEPNFKSLECHPKNEPKFYICKVRIGKDILMSSYPSEEQDELAARDLAAKKAYDHLCSDSKSSIGVCKNDSVTLSRIFDMIKTKEYGVWSNKVPVLYLDSYNEELQSNWLDLIKNSTKFEITSIEKVGFIIRTKNESAPSVIEDVRPTLEVLKVPESNHWEVYITNVVTSAEVWCRLIGKDYSETYDTMMTKLELQPPTVNVKNPAVGEIYLVNIEESWNRVKVIDIYLDKEEASVFLIDIGVDEVVKLSQLFYLEKSFFSVPPQALLLSLNELDYLAECEELQSALFHSLLGSTFIAEIVAILDEGGNVCSVNLWDTSTEEDVNINLKLLDDVIKTIKSPSLPTVGLVKEMFISYIDDNGDIFIQTSKQNSQFVDYIISTKMKNTGKLVPVSLEFDPKKLYITRSVKTGLFYRAKILSSLASDSFIVKFIDYGFEHQTKLEDLFDLEDTCLDLATVPSQAIRVKFANLKTINNKILAKLREYILEQNVLVKTIKVPQGCLPYVEIFKRSQADGTLSSINNKIIDDKELQYPDTSARKSVVAGLENTLSRNLPMPNIPPIGSYFNVFVTLAAHPNLFSVQPLSTKNELMELMFRLQDKCESSFLKPLLQKDFKIGELYAVKHADNFWYRAYAHAIVSSTAFSVCLCDFGDFIMVPPEKLMFLPSEFKTFPYQAIRAYLAGIAPVNKDWSAIDCVKFRELVIEKEFVSQIVEINRDVKNPNYISLGLILVDTSTPDDIYIHKLLIDRKMAVLKK